MNKPQRSRSRVSTDESSLCQFSFADGRTCRMFREPGHPCLCIFHARAERQLAESDRLGSELADTLTGKFMTATDINFALGRLYQAIVQNRIPPRNASNLAFVGKLLLLSLDKLKDEFRFQYQFEQWRRMENSSKPLSSPPYLSSEVQPGNPPAVPNDDLQNNDTQTTPDPALENPGGSS